VNDHYNTTDGSQFPQVQGHLARQGIIMLIFLVMIY